MSKILLFVLPLPSHLNIVAMLADSLQQRGHEVVFAGMKDAQAKIESLGFPFVPLFAKRLPAGLMQEWLTGDVIRDTWRKKLDYLLGERRKIIDHEHFVEELINGGYQEVVDAVREIAPDLIVVDVGLHTYWPLMTRMTGVRCIYISPMLPLSQHDIIPPLNSLLPPAGDFAGRVRVRAAWEWNFIKRWLVARVMNLAGIPDPIANFHRLAQATGCPDAAFNSRSLMFPELDFPLMTTTPAEFEFPQALGRPNIHYVGAILKLDRVEPAFPWELLDPAKKLIFCSLGSVAYSHFFFQNVVDAVSKEPSWQLVVNIGPKIKPEMLQRVPQGTILVNGAPQLAILRKAHVMINHGGINSVRECAYLGVPQLVFPLFFDQNGSAARVAYHGLGMSAQLAKAGPDQIREWIAAILSDSAMQERCHEMSKAFQRQATGAPAAKVVEQFLPQANSRTTVV